MGWWQINNESGCIDFSSADKSGLLNKYPGEDSIDELYNGDGPADLFDSALGSILKGKNADRIASVLIRDITKEYEEEWGRPPRPQEWVACLNFASSVYEDSKAGSRAVKKLRASLQKKLAKWES